VGAINAAATIFADDLAGMENVPVTLLARVVDPGQNDTHTFSIV